MKFWLSARHSLLVLAAATLAACVPPKATDVAKVEWMTDGDKAINAARQQGKPLFIAFVGSDWSTASKDVEKDIFNTRAFKDFADANLVLLKVEFSRQLSPQQQTAYTELARGMQVDRFPVFFLADPTNNQPVFQRFNGYGSGGPGEFISQLAASLAQYRAARAAYQAQAQSQMAGQAAAPPPTMAPSAGSSGLPSPEELLQQVRSQPQMAPGVSVRPSSAVAPIGMPANRPPQNLPPGMLPAPSSPAPGPASPDGTDKPLIDLK
ncbi:MAG TPA: thioredoxin family protein [Opitutales bacterium]|nr:thioredoxin family protein [Opitutales bacterium]